MRVLIIGTGYVGFPTAVELVRRGHEVYGLRRDESARQTLESAGIKPLFADITRAASFSTLPCGFDWIVNCVAAGGGGESAYQQIYLQGMRNLVDWISTWPRPAGSPRLVYTSSTSVYAQNDGSVVNEQSPAEPTAETARILLATEQELLAGARKANLTAIVLRAAGIYGPGRGYWLKQFLSGEARLDGDGSRIINMIHRDDVVGSILAALEKGAGGEIYNAVDDEPVSQLTLFSWLAQHLSRPMPPASTETAPAQRKRGATNKRISNHKLKNELAMQFKYPTFREGYLAELRDISITPNVP